MRASRLLWILLACLLVPVAFAADAVVTEEKSDAEINAAVIEAQIFGSEVLMSTDEPFELLLDAITPNARFCVCNPDASDGGVGGCYNAGCRVHVDCPDPEDWCVEVSPGCGLCNC